MLTQDKREPCYADTDLMPFGKYKGEPLQDVPASYLIWLYGEFKPVYSKTNFENIHKIVDNNLADIMTVKLKLFNYIHNSMDALKLEVGDK